MPSFYLSSFVTLSFPTSHRWLFILPSPVPTFLSCKYSLPPFVSRHFLSCEFTVMSPLSVLVLHPSFINSNLSILQSLPLYSLSIYISHLPLNFTFKFPSFYNCSTPFLLCLSFLAPSSSHHNFSLPIFSSFFVPLPFTLKLPRPSFFASYFSSLLFSLTLAFLFSRHFIVPLPFTLKLLHPAFLVSFNLPFTLKTPTSCLLRLSFLLLRPSIHS